MAAGLFDLEKELLLLERHPLGFRSNCLPRWAFAAAARRVRDYLRLRTNLARLKSATDGRSDLGEIFDEVERRPEFRSDQKRTEIVALLESLAEKPPRFVCEIGIRRGGTTFLLAQVCEADATIISIDKELSFVRSLINRR